MGARLGVLFLLARRDATSCPRTAAMVNPAGTVCATVTLDGSADCAADARVSPDGTLVLHGRDSCSTVWWPGLGRL